MTEDPERAGPSSRDSEADDEMKRLLRSALASEQAPRGDVLEGVQKKIRQRSAGRFYADRWSTAKQPPVRTYLVTSLLMLVAVVIVYLVLSPLRGQARGVPHDPAPIQILPP